MNKILTFLCLIILISGCKNEVKNVASQQTDESETYASFGDKINSELVLNDAEADLKYNNLVEGDTLVTKLKGTIKEVCSNKGCWMKLDVGNNKEVMVRFKDYGFFMPLDAEGEVIINGKAFVTETSVDELRHYAEDGGKTAEEIAAIIEPQKTFAFEADGVLLKQK